MKGYLSRLSSMEVIAPEESNEDEITLYKVNTMAYEKDEYATDKFVSVFSAMTFTNDTVFLIVDGHETRTDFYIGVKNNDNRYTAHSIADTFESSIKGQFPGIKLSDMSVIEEGHKSSELHKFLRDLNDATSVSSFVGVPSERGEGSHTNSSYIQGIEKFADAMRGKRYTAIIIARNQSQDAISQLRMAYERLYSQLSCLGQQQMSYSVNESTAKSLTQSNSESTTKSHSISNGTSKSQSHNTSKSNSTSEGTNESHGESKENFWGKGASMASPLIQAGAILAGTGVGAPAGAILMGAGAVLGIGGVLGKKTKSKSSGTSSSHSQSTSESNGTTVGKSHNESDSTSRGHTTSTSEGNTSTAGKSRNFTLTLHNKQVEDMLNLIDRQLERISTAKSNGLWSASSYFLSYDNDRASSQTGAAIFRSIVQGDKSNIEASTLNTWRVDDSGNGKSLLQCVTKLSFPLFRYFAQGANIPISVEGTSLISSSELAMMMGLPRKSVPGLPVIDYVSLGKEVVRSSGMGSKGDIAIGSIFDRGVVYKGNRVNLDAKSLTQHVFVTGSTGCGKSETVYTLIDQARKQGATYLVIEPAKGEYKSVFGNANVFGTNPLLMPLLKINPFCFPEGIHILEHIDKLIDIFNVCWPMYAAMPAVLKKAVLKSYEKCGWDMYRSTNKYGQRLFPSFEDLLEELENTINESAYSDEVKGNYIGSLVTRVETLTNGINGEIFSANETGDSVLFDSNTIIDLSRIGSQETKAMIMGILIMRLNEHRIVTADVANAKLKHLTVLEEAHNILTRTSTEQSMEGSNVTGKSVEMIVNSIAEMRTYGEGFVIVDQSPTSVHAAAIKNTNTKIIMRLPDGDDRLIAGKSAGLKDDQTDELSKLPTGVAVVYQNDWIQPVMCKITLSTFKRVQYGKHPDQKVSEEAVTPIAEILKLLLKGRLVNGEEPNIDTINKALPRTKLPVSIKAQVMASADEYRETGKLTLWKDENFVELSNLVTSILGLGKKVNDAADKAATFDDLNIMLDTYIHDVVNVPENLYLTIRQMLMRNYSTKGASQLKIYSAWLTDLKKKLAKGHIVVRKNNK